MIIAFGHPQGYERGTLVCSPLNELVDECRPDRYAAVRRIHPHGDDFAPTGLVRIRFETGSAHNLITAPRKSNPGARNPCAPDALTIMAFTFKR